MKQIITIVTLLCSGVLFSQETAFTFTKDGFTDFVVVSVPNKTQAELYKKTLDWVSVTYNNPKEVIKAQIENDYIRIEGVKENALCMNVMLSRMCDDVKYQIEISFKEGKYKFDVVSVQQFLKTSEVSVISGWRECGFMNTTAGFYKSNGELKNVFKDYPQESTSMFNEINDKLKDFLLSDSIPSKKSDW